MHRHYAILCLLETGCHWVSPRSYHVRGPTFCSRNTLKLRQHSTLNSRLPGMRRFRCLYLRSWRHQKAAIYNNKKERNWEKKHVIREAWKEVSAPRTAWHVGLCCALYASPSQTCGQTLSMDLFSGIVCTSFVWTPRNCSDLFNLSQSIQPLQFAPLGCTVKQIQEWLVQLWNCFRSFRSSLCVYTTSVKRCQQMSIDIKSQGKSSGPISVRSGKSRAQPTNTFFAVLNFLDLHLRVESNAP